MWVHHNDLDLVEIPAFPGCMFQIIQAIENISSLFRDLDQFQKIGQFRVSDKLATYCSNNGESCIKFFYVGVKLTRN